MERANIDMRYGTIGIDSGEGLDFDSPPFIKGERVTH